MFKIHENQNIVIALSVAFLIAFCLFYIVLNYLSHGANIYEKNFYSELAQSSGD